MQRSKLWTLKNAAFAQLLDGGAANLGLGLGYPSKMRNNRGKKLRQRFNNANRSTCDFG